MILKLERERQALQKALDDAKTPLERNKLGQFSTPIELANEILQYGLSICTGNEINFLDPAFGTGTFYSALLQKENKKKINKATGFEIDHFYGNPTRNIWAKNDLDLSIADFTTISPKPSYNLVICNPPYVRQQHIASSEKARLQTLSFTRTGIKLSGLAGLYCHFLLLSHSWMSSNAISGWLIPSEFMDVNYGSALKKYLLDDVTLLHIHRFDPLEGQFADALVSSAIVWFKNTPPQKEHSVKFSFGGSLLNPKVSKQINSDILREEKKWTRFPNSNVRVNDVSSVLEDFFNIRRGLATGANKFFIVSENWINNRKLPFELFRPILPGPQSIKDNIVNSDSKGVPELAERLFLLDTSYPEEYIKNVYPTLFTYIEEGKVDNIDKGYICSHRSPWYSQEKRAPAPIICTYMGRATDKAQHPFRFILNNTNATMTNAYLGLYPTARLLSLAAKQPDLIEKIWERLSQISIADMIDEGRVYGGGLHKLEPKELAKVPMPFVDDLLSIDAPSLRMAIC